MIRSDIVFGKIDASSVKISERELTARLGGEYSAIEGRVLSTIAKMREISEPKYTATELKIEFFGGGVMILDGARIESVGLERVLWGCRRVLLLAVTLGAAVDRALRVSSQSGIEESFVLDSVASAFIEGAADYAEGELLGEREGTKRFSPGYSDLSLLTQKFILKRLSAESLLGVTLSDSNLMIPTKTVTAIVGIKA